MTMLMLLALADATAPTVAAAAPTAADWLKANWKELLSGAIVLCNAIVGMTNFPKAAGFASTLLRVLNAITIVTHKDSPGTFKAPLVNSKPPEDGALVESEPPRGFTSLRFLLVVVGVGVMLTSACSYFSKQKFKEGEIDCGRAALHELVDDFLPDVTLALTSPNPDWHFALEHLAGLLLADGVTTAKEAVACAVAAAVASFEKPQAPTAPEPPRIGTACASTAPTVECIVDARALAALRGQAYLTFQRVSPVLPKEAAAR